jgi:hypothetical protein
VKIVYIISLIKLILVGITIKVSVTSIKNKNIIGFYWIFGIISILAFFQLFYAQLISPILLKNQYLFINNLIRNFYITIEFFLLIIYFKRKISSKNISNFFSIIIFLISIFFLHLIIQDNYFISNNYSLFAAFEAILMLTLSTILFVEIINNDNILSLYDSPDFIITCGIFFLFSFTCPFYILNNYLEKINFQLLFKISFISDIGYIAFYYSILKAMKCKIRISK